jgi:ABC-type nitrate/sulfonate/bicarbonate transport system substrate-binding protein
VHGAADQSVALAEDGADADAIIVAGGDDGFNHLFVQPEIATLAGLRGRTLAADVANTGWSFVLYRMLRLAGLERTDYTVAGVGAPFRRFAAMRDAGLAAAILNPPFAIHARNAGFRDMGAVVDTVGPYLGTVPYVLRGWAAANAATLVAYLQASVEGLRFALAPENRAAAQALYAERLNVTPEIAAEMVRLAADPVRGFARDAAFDHAGFANVLALRGEAEDRALRPPESYVDLSYYDQALAGL